jgi:hypothetical protein
MAGAFDCPDTRAMRDLSSETNGLAVPSAFGHLDTGGSSG